MLIVDDEDGILSSLEAILQDEGYRVAKASTGEHALDLVRAEVPDVILVDVWMPGIDGIKTLQAVKETSADTEVIVMSGHGNIDTAVTATKLGAFDFIEKPLSMETVLRVVSQAVQSRRARDAKSAGRAVSFLDGNDPKVDALCSALEEAAGDLRPLVLLGERGTGKRHLAHVLHNRGITREGPFAPLHCRSLASPKRKSDLQASLRRLLPKEGSGTVYLDGWEQAPAEERAGILDALAAWTKDGHRLLVAIDEDGGEAVSLWDQAAERLRARKLHLPPLRERRGDILTLAKSFLAEAAREGGRERDFAEDALASLYQYDWRGNVTELKSAVTRAAFSAPGRMVRAEHLPSPLHGGSLEAGGPGAADFNEARKEWERKFLSLHLIHHQWNVAATAQAIGLTPATLGRMLKRHGIEPPATPPRSAPGGRQRTIGHSLVLYGRGLHSGLKTGLIIEPLPPNSGIRFGSLTTPDTVAARAEFVDNTNHATNLRNGPVVARTIEHLMSALHAHGVTNLLVKIGEEVPVMDGSAVEFCRLLEEAGLEEQGEGAAPLTLDRAYEVGEPGSPEGYLRAEPADELSISYLLDLPKPIGRQACRYRHTGPEAFTAEIAPARTFSFIWELENLERMGLGEGGRWGNFILVDKERVVNTELRFPDEFVRHKILDLMGDLYLLGRPLRAKVTAERTGHRHNVALVRLLTETLL
ncbi:MAG: UDP-3-O-[3-hydroxymyristoyl] N-acetylglucosamine deacetylase [Candidatus Tectomicrobia bacterium RIFCSPLOWO2_12_FULL_69_37]|nr:MAG: UDP-3-O-[3-hydroxymyristoyl] N-acetylglucosamine deacetylase [Candidatus Tectomicrobia bacterium RIFCSPLOWO2_12_FULL_69_37]